MRHKSMPKTVGVNSKLLRVETRNAVSDCAFAYYVPLCANDGSINAHFRFC